MMISDQQVAAIIGPGQAKWEEIARPEGRQPLPAWCKDAAVRWYDDYGNSPDFLLKTSGPVFDWPDKVFSFKDGVYTASTDDGRLEQYGHDGKLSIGKLKRFRAADGTLRSHPRQMQQGGFEPGEWVEVDAWMTTPQQGFAGRHFTITLDDGREVILRGPWHIGAPKGYQAVTAVDRDEIAKWNRGRFCRPWHQRGGCFGLFLKHDALIAIVSHYLAHLRLARVTYSYGTYIEPLKPEWDAPKHFVMEAQRNARRAA